MSARMSFFILMVASFRFESLSLLLNSPSPSSSSSIHFFALVLSSLFPLFLLRPPCSAGEILLYHSFYPQPHPTKLKARLFRVPLLIPLSLLLRLPSPYLPLGPRPVLLDLFLSCFSWFNSFLLSRRECLNSLRPLFTPCLSPPTASLSSLLFSCCILEPPLETARKVEPLSLSLSLSV